MIDDNKNNEDDNDNNDFDYDDDNNNDDYDDGSHSPPPSCSWPSPSALSWSKHSPLPEHKKYDNKKLINKPAWQPEHKIQWIILKLWPFIKDSSTLDPPLIIIITILRPWREQFHLGSTSQRSRPCLSCRPPSPTIYPRNAPTQGLSEEKPSSGSWSEYCT